MAQQEYLIKLSSKTSILPVFDTSMNRMELSRRDTEIAALDAMVAFASKGEKNVEKFNLCTDLSRQLENLDDNEEWIITKGDLALLREGFRISAEINQRPALWSKLKEIFDQLNEPLKIEREMPPPIQKEPSEKKSSA